MSRADAERSVHRADVLTIDASSQTVMGEGHCAVIGVLAVSSLRQFSPALVGMTIA